MPRPIPAEVSDAIRRSATLVFRHAPALAGEADTLRRALDAESPILELRLRRLVAAALSEPHLSGFGPEDRAELGEAAALVSEWADGRPGARGRSGSECRLHITLSLEDADALRAYCDRESVSQAEAVRRAVRLYIEVEGTTDPKEQPRKSPSQQADSRLSSCGGHGDAKR